MRATTQARSQSNQRRDGDVFHALFDEAEETQIEPRAFSELLLSQTKCKTPPAHVGCQREQRR